METLCLPPKARLDICQHYPYNSAILALESERQHQCHITTVVFKIVSVGLAAILDYLSKD